MPTRLVQGESQAAGSAAFRVGDPVATQFQQTDHIEIAIIQIGQTERYLDPRDPDDPWTTSVYRFRPLNPRREGGMLVLDVDYGVSYHLRANQPYKLRLRESGGAEADEVFTVPAAMRRPAAKPTGWTPPPDPRGPLTAPAVAPDPAPAPPPSAPPPAVVAAAPASDLVVPAPEPPPAVDPPLFTSPPVAPPPAGRKWLVPALLLVLLGGGAAAWWLLAGPAESGGVQSMDDCRRLVATGPEAAAARGQAEQLGQQDKLLDCQFLLSKYAGEKGDRDAARMLGTWYDPDTWSKEKSPLPAPNPTEAARWHKQAAEAGDAQSQYRYGMLLKLGRTDAPDGPEQAQVWLRKAAEQGFALAKEELAR